MEQESSRPSPRIDRKALSGTADCVFVARPASLAEHLFGPDLAALDDFASSVTSGEGWTSPELLVALRDADCLITGWGVPEIPVGLLAQSPRLRAVVHAGGAVPESLLTEAARVGLVVRDVGLANAVPVAEFAVAMILLAGKEVFTASRLYRSRQAFIDREVAFPDAGNFGRVVGIVGASRIGRLVIEKLRGTDVRVLVVDPFLDPDGAAALGAELVSLSELCVRSDIVSLHAPELPQTRGMLGRTELALLRDGATVVNTARGSLIDQEALVEELRRGRLRAILDVTEPDVLPPDHPLFGLDGVFLTPHVAGSMGNELRRMGAAVVSAAREALSC